MDESRRGQVVYYNGGLQSISAIHAEGQFSALLDAAQLEPVAIRNESRDIVVVMSKEEYERISDSNRAQFLATCDRISKAAQARGLTEQILVDILSGNG